MSVDLRHLFTTWAQQCRSWLAVDRTLSATARGRVLCCDRGASPGDWFTEIILWRSKMDLAIPSAHKWSRSYFLLQDERINGECAIENVSI